ncbi:MAG: XrtA system polysaccharide chain length determinant [Pseudomonadota bacterium]
MQDVIAQILQHVRATWRYRWYMVLVAWPVCVAGWVFVQTLPDQYQASARMFLDTQSILKPLLKGLTVDSSAQSEVELMNRTILSRPNMEKVARMTDLDIEAKTPEQMDALISKLISRINIEDARRQAGLFRITYEDSNPQVAKRVVQALLTIFMESSLGETRKDTDVAQRFLDQQLKEYETRLVASETRLTEFKRENLGRMPNQGRDYYESLQAAISDSEQAQLQLKEAENRRQELQRQIEDNETPSFGLGPAAPMSDTPVLNARIQNLQTRMDELLLNFTEQHPDVQAVKNTIADLEKQRAEVIATQAKSASKARPAADDGIANPYQSQMKLALSEAEANVASLKARVGTYRKRVDEFKKLVDIIPEVEAQLKQLNRDYDVTKSNYETLLARRESATISEQLDQSAEAVKFRVVDPPYVPGVASGPNRPLLISGILLGGIAAGIVFAFFLAQLNPTFNSRRTLMEVTGLPVLGGVSMIWTAAQIRRKRVELLGFSALMGTLVALYGGIMAIQLLDINLMSHVKALI